MPPLSLGLAVTSLPGRIWGFGNVIEERGLGTEGRRSVWISKAHPERKDQR